MIRLREIGDVVFTTPAVRALRSHFPHAHLTYIVEPSAAPVVLNNPRIDELLIAPRGRGISGFVADVALGRRLRAGRYDVSIDFHGGPRASLLTWLSGAPKRIGYQISGRAWMYTDRVARPRELRPRHSVENQWDLLAPLGIAAPTRDDFPVEMIADPATRAAVDTRLAAAGITRDHQLIVMHVSAGNPFRRWPLERFTAVAQALLARDARRRVIVTSGPSERDAAARVVTDAGALVCGEFSLTELRALVDRAALYIGGDSGPLHIAATSGVPVVALYGPTLPQRSEPWRAPQFLALAVDAGPLPCRPCDQRVCAPGDFRCLTWIEPENVIEAAERLLANPKKDLC